MTKELSNFVMIGVDANGVEYRIVMTDDETRDYIRSGYGEYFDDANEVWEEACNRVGLIFDDMPDMITHEEVA